MKLLYKPFAIVLGIAGGIAGRKTFQAVWRTIDRDGPPDAAVEGSPVGKAIAAVALEAAILAGVRAATTRAGLQGWKKFSGSWAGKRPAEPNDEAAQAPGSNS